MAPEKEKVSNNLHDDIVFYILSRLPLKSLKRFSCVCKSWANLFENPLFMNMYRNNFLNNHDDDNSSLLLKHSTPNTFNYSLFWLSGGEAFGNRVKLDWPPPFQEDETGIFILGCVVNGTLCLYQGRGDASPPEIAVKVVLWNPTTEEFNVIPPGSVDCPLGVIIWVDLHGFGYDPVTDDYKLIRYLQFDEDDWVDHVPEPLWQIYSLRSNSWKKLDIEMPTSSLIATKVYLNGFCHWLGYIREQPNEFPEEVLVSFNLSDEVFHITPFDGIGRCAPDGFRRHLAVLKESIATITIYFDTDCCDISILGEFGVKDSWTKLFSIGPLPCVMSPIGFGKKGKLFFRKDYNELAWFDLSNQMVEEIGVKGDCLCRMLIYKKKKKPSSYWRDK